MDDREADDDEDLLSYDPEWCLFWPASVPAFHLDIWLPYLRRSRYRFVLMAGEDRFNDAVRVLAARRNATLVDVYAALASNVPLYIGNDDLHPTEEGYRVVANTFFAAIRTSLEQAPTGAGLRVR